MAASDFEVLDERFARLPCMTATVRKLYGECDWAEGPAYFPGGRYLVWSDAPNKVRVGDQSAANFIGGLGATGVPMPFGEVQQSLARGVVDCAITGPASANSGGWPEATTTVLPLALQMAVNGYAINLDKWNSLSSVDQEKLQAAITGLTDDIWSYSEELYSDAMRCNSGQTPCSLPNSYSLKQAPVSEADVATVAAAVGEVSLPVWAEQCDAVFAECEAKWMETVGVQLGL